MTASHSIVVEDLSVDRGKAPALQAVSLRIAAGQVTGLLGPSGCGKTTLMRSIVGTQIVKSGRVAVLDVPAGSRELRRRVAYVTQAHSFYRDLTVAENVAYFASVYGASRDDVDRAISTVGLADFAHRMASDMSGGQQSRVALATALVARPEVLILDEPTVGLDPVLRRELWTLFGELAAAGSTVVVSTHVMDEAERCDDLVLLRDGRVLAQGSPSELRQRTGTDDIESAFLALIAQAAA